MSSESIRNFIKQQYESSGMGQRQIASKAGISAQALNAYLAGGNMRDVHLDALLRVFGRELDHGRLKKRD